MTTSYRSAFISCFVLSGLFVPVAVSVWALFYGLSFRSGPNPWWGIVAYLVFVVILAIKRLRNPSRPGAQGAFTGAIAGLAFAVLVLTSLTYLSSQSDSEKQKQIFVFTSAPTNLRVIDSSGKILWSIEQVETNIAFMGSISYGKVPPGFRQIIPPGSSPRKFILNEALQVHAESSNFLMNVSGFARGEDRLEQNISSFRHK